MIERITGTRPLTCPWRALYEPIVHEVLGVMAFAENGNMGVALGPDPVAALVDACRVYQVARTATRIEDERIAAAEREARVRAKGGRS